MTASMSHPLDLFSVQGRSILITGATGSLGGVAAQALATAGARVTLAGGDTSALAELNLELTAAGIDPANVVTVGRRPDTPEAAAEITAAAVDAFGGIDGVLVASGMNKVGPIVDMDVDTWQSVMDANVKGSWLICQAVGRVMLAQDRGGSVVLVSSTRGKLGLGSGYSAYCPSKAAVDLLAKTLAAEWGGAQIRVNAIAPTVFRSELTAWMFADDEKGRATREAMFSRIPLRRFAEPDDFIGALVYMLSDASKFVTGQVLYIDGGYTAC
ncbi:MAG: SDR family oxidoreductase [Actinobacteria bacterium]|nr:SDR family oxidoreductase [Actinomycetota bacterium]